MGQPVKNNIRALRLAAGMTQGELVARALEHLRGLTLSVSQLSLMENDRRNINLQHLEAIAKALGVAVADLVDEGATMPVELRLEAGGAAVELAEPLAVAPPRGLGALRGVAVLAPAGTIPFLSGDWVAFFSRLAPVTELEADEIFLFQTADGHYIGHGLELEPGCIALTPPAGPARRIVDVRTAGGLRLMTPAGAVLRSPENATE